VTAVGSRSRRVKHTPVHLLVHNPLPVNRSSPATALSHAPECAGELHTSYADHGIHNEHDLDVAPIAAALHHPLEGEPVPAADVPALLEALASPLDVVLEHLGNTVEDSKPHGPPAPRALLVVGNAESNKLVLTERARPLRQRRRLREGDAITQLRAVDEPHAITEAVLHQAVRELELTARCTRVEVVAHRQRPVAQSFLMVPAETSCHVHLARARKATRVGHTGAREEARVEVAVRK